MEEKRKGVRDWLIGMGLGMKKEREGWYVRDGKGFDKIVGKGYPVKAGKRVGRGWRGEGSVNFDFGITP
ncbi:hypothetical protein HZH68_016661 [Vespula germanica]|uniref:Uncharacterized protein n=1 Tax=Vespula germanica TaxID=30212 RepID=A0A834MQZ5_VESGE|nr:hypothetical protein HZH68_016661 [Vespula germanica]